MTCYEQEWSQNWLTFGSLMCIRPIYTLCTWFCIQGPPAFQCTTLKSWEWAWGRGYVYTSFITPHACTRGKVISLLWLSLQKPGYFEVTSPSGCTKLSILAKTICTCICFSQSVSITNHDLYMSSLFATPTEATGLWGIMTACACPRSV